MYDHINMLRGPPAPPVGFALSAAYSVCAPATFTTMQTPFADGTGMWIAKIFLAGITFMLGLLPAVINKLHNPNPIAGDVGLWFGICGGLLMAATLVLRTDVRVVAIGLILAIISWILFVVMIPPHSSSA
jgi:hypothetical protein